MSFVDDIEERDTEVIDCRAFWKLVNLAIRAGLTTGFMPSPRCETDAEYAESDRIAASVDAAIQRGRRDAGIS